jgi:hypothetical protein
LIWNEKIWNKFRTIFGICLQELVSVKFLISASK